MTFRNQQLFLPILSIPSNRYVHNICHICQTTQTAERESDSRTQIVPNSEQQNHQKSLQGLRTCLTSPKKKYLGIFQRKVGNGKGLEMELIYMPPDN